MTATTASNNMVLIRAKEASLLQQQQQQQQQPLATRKVPSLSSASMTLSSSSTTLSSSSSNSLSQQQQQQQQQQHHQQQGDRDNTTSSSSSSLGVMDVAPQLVIPDESLYGVLPLLQVERYDFSSSVLLPCDNDETSTTADVGSSRSSSSLSHWILVQPKSSPPSLTMTTSNQDQPPPSYVVSPPETPASVGCVHPKDVTRHVQPDQIPPVDGSLNLYLGMSDSIGNPDRYPTLLWLIRFLDHITLFRYWDVVIFAIWNHLVPWTMKRWLNQFLWHGMYFRRHYRLLNRSTGLHPAASPQYHAMTTLLWIGRWFPVTVRRMRFALEQLSVLFPRAPHTMQVHDWMVPVSSLSSSLDLSSLVGNRISLAPAVNPAIKAVAPTTQKHYIRPRGIYIRNQDLDVDIGGKTKQQQPYTLFWIYGGAFLGGTVQSNVGLASAMGQACGMHVYLPHYRLLPENTVEDVLWDITLNYVWLYEHLRDRQGGDPGRIIMLGISSGAGLCMRLLQSIAEFNRGEECFPSCIRPLLGTLLDEISNNSSNNKIIMPAGAVLIGPFVDYTKPSGSFVHCQVHDLIVNQRVMETAAPLLDDILGLDPAPRQQHSPIYRNMHDLPPLCVITSRHEVVYDQTVVLVRRARAAGVPVTVACWQFVGHVWCMMAEFVPEGRQALDFATDWIRQHVVVAMASPKANNNSRCSSSIKSPEDKGGDDDSGCDHNATISKSLPRPQNGTVTSPADKKNA